MNQPLEELLSIWGELLKAWASLHSCVVSGARWFVNRQSRHMQAIALVQSPVKKWHVAEHSQGGMNSTQRICSVISSSKKGHVDSRKMCKPLLQSNKLCFWASWGFMTIWLVMLRNVSKKSTSARKMPVHWKWNVLQKYVNLNNSANKTVLCLFFARPTSFSDVPWRTVTQLRSPQLLNFQDICIPELLPTFYAQETCFHKQREELIGQGFQTFCHSIQSPSLGWSLPKPASWMKCKEPSVSIAQPGYWPRASGHMGPWLCGHGSLGSQLPWNYSSHLSIRLYVESPWNWPEIVSLWVSRFQEFREVDFILGISICNISETKYFRVWF